MDEAIYKNQESEAYFGLCQKPLWIFYGKIVNGFSSWRFCNKAPL